MICVAVFLLACLQSLGGVQINAETEKYIAHCIDIHQADTSGLLLGAVIQPPTCLPSDIVGNHFLLPKLFLWDPLKCYKLFCPTHKVELKPSFWLGKKQKWRRPRVLYDLHGNTLLVARYYICTPNKNCRYLSIDDQLMLQIPSHVQVPFVLCHRSGCTHVLIDYVFEATAQGTPFTDIARHIQETNRENFTQRINSLVQHGLGIPQNELRELVQQTVNTFQDNELFTAPSPHFIETIFLQIFKERREIFRKSMCVILARRLRVLFLPMDSSTQYRHLIIAMNERQQVVSWAMTRGVEFDNVRPLFSALRDRLRRRDCTLEAIMTEFCCQWGEDLSQIFTNFESTVSQSSTTHTPNTVSLGATLGYNLMNCSTSNGPQPLVSLSSHATVSQGQNGAFSLVDSTTNRQSANNHESLNNSTFPNSLYQQTQTAGFNLTGTHVLTSAPSTITANIPMANQLNQGSSAFATHIDLSKSTSASTVQPSEFQNSTYVPVSVYTQLAGPSVTQAYLHASTSGLYSQRELEGGTEGKPRSGRKIVKTDLRKALRDVSLRATKRGGDNRITVDAFERDLGHVFRSLDKHDIRRRHLTPDAASLRVNLEAFKQKLEELGEERANSEMLHEIELLMAHVGHGCFSEIQLQDENESEREQLVKILRNGDKAVLSHVKNLGPELLFAVFTVLFHYWNKSKTAKFTPYSRCEKHGNEAKKPRIEKGTSENASLSDKSLKWNIDINQFFPDKNSLPTCEQFGFIESFRCDQNGEYHKLSALTSRNVSNFDDLLTPQISSHLLSTALDMQEIVGRISDIILNQEESTDSFQIAHVQLGYIFNGSWSNTSRVSCTNSNELGARLDAQLEKMGLQRVCMLADGDCAFTSVLDQLDRYIQGKDASTELCNHLKQLGLSHEINEGSSNNRVLRMRELLVEELLRKREELLPHCVGLHNPSEYNTEAMRFLNLQVFSGQMGDLVIRALASVIRCPIVVVTSVSTVPLVPFIPEKALIKTPLYVAYNHYGPGHYDSTKPVTRMEPKQDEPANTGKNTTSCRCGVNSVKHTDKVSCSNSGEEGRLGVTKYKTRCQCHKANRDCVNCLCVNCANENNPPNLLCTDHFLLRCKLCKNSQGCHAAGSLQEKVRKGQKRHADGGGIDKSKEIIHLKEWSSLESCLLQVTLSFLSNTGLSLRLSYAEKLFNFVCADPTNIALGLELKTKSSAFFIAKLKSVKSKIQDSLKLVDINFEISRLLNSILSISDSQSETDSTTLAPNQRQAIYGNSGHDQTILQQPTEIAYPYISQEYTLQQNNNPPRNPFILPTTSAFNHYDSVLSFSTIPASNSVYSVNNASTVLTETQGINLTLGAHIGNQLPGVHECMMGAPPTTMHAQNLSLTNSHNAQVTNLQQL